MNLKLAEILNQFFHDISYYVLQEYPDYYDHVQNEKQLHKTLNMIQNYYLGGNNVPDTAGYIVEYFKGKQWLDSTQD